MLVQDRHLRITVTGALEHPFVLATYKQGLHNSEQKKQAQTVLKGCLDKFRNLAGQSLLKRATMLLVAMRCGYNLDEMYSQRLAFRMLDMAGNGELSVVALERALGK